MYFFVFALKIPVNESISAKVAAKRSCFGVSFFEWGKTLFVKMSMKLKAMVFSLILLINPDSGKFNGIRISYGE